MSTPALLRICRLRSLSRLRTSDWLSTVVKTFMASNWRTTAAP